MKVKPEEIDLKNKPSTEGSNSSPRPKWQQYYIRTETVTNFL